MRSKRLLDLVIGVPAAIVLTPVIAVLALLVVATSGRPAFVVQTRVGAGERPIRVIKMRTMRRDAPLLAKAELVRAGIAAERSLYTSLGPFMRSTSLDELPQIYHVVQGTMSLVGPRPALPSQHDLLTLRRRCGVTALKPGLTGLAQITGRESLTLATKVRLEAHYLRHSSVAMDLAILARTPAALLSRRGAF
jgi:O-antigen biosynthesis protein WbqP